MNKTAIKSFAIEARKKLVSEITYRAGLVGINKDGISEPIHKASGIEMYDIGGNEPYTIKGEEISQRNSLAARVRDKGFEKVVEEVAYTWFNRIIAIRFMEVNDYLPTRVRVLSSENKDKTEPDIVTEAPNVELGFTPTEIDEVLQLKHDNKLDELFRLLFIKQCNALNDILPELFEKTSDYTELLLSISFTNEDSIVRELVRSIEEEDYREQVEIIGWLYQYYNAEPKAKVDVYVKKGVKVIKEDIPAKTQLFTPDWIVRYMVENSLGRLWIEAYPESNIKDNWKYYLVDENQNQEVKIQLEKIKEESKNIKPEDIKFIDPSMGSGHILVYAFDVFMDIYKAYGYSEREAVKLIIQNNLFGLDIDDRAYQLAYFAVLMKARKYARKILNEKIKPQLCSIQESNGISEEVLEYFADGNKDILGTLKYIIDTFEDAKEYGSILNVEKIDVNLLYKRVDEITNSEPSDFFSIIHKQKVISRLLPLIKQTEIMCQKYEVVVTNPPYLSSSDMNVKLSNYVKKNYPNTKGDLFAVFIEKGFEWGKHNGFNSMVTMQAWMFLSSYQKFREQLFMRSTIYNLMHMENNVMPIAFGTCATVFRNKLIKGFEGTYNHIETKDITDANLPYEFPVRKNRNTYVNSEKFSEIPGLPIAYWVSEKMRNVFKNSINLKSICEPRQGMATTNNSLFLRLWYEVNISKIGFNLKSEAESILSGFKWFPYNKGGSFRKWYGNNEYVVNFENGGREVCNYIDKFSNSRVNHKGRVINREYYFKKSITWSFVSSSYFGVRYCTNGFIFDVGGSSTFPNDKEIYYMTGYLCSKLSFEYMKIQNPTLNFQVGNVANLPVIISQSYKPSVDKIVEENILISKRDWDSFETSWDFVVHPFLIYKQSTIQKTFTKWQEFTQKQFDQLKDNEEELNRIFIEIYGLQDEFSPKVDEKDVTIKIGDLQRDVKGFISYSIGCMFGRYSLDIDGLIYAGGEWDNSKYKSFIPDEDNIIPITDDEYFTDDIVGRFIEFVKVTYGEDTIEENLEFIATALGCKGDTSREVIRNYFIKDFYKDHCSMYSSQNSGKRPIYWMFDSGKENGFKALIYMHRYNEDTVARVRTDYLHKVQKAIESAIESADIIMDSATSSAQKAKAVKQKEKLVKQLAETKNYDAAIGHVASQRIGIDLDDGMTANYAKFQGVEVSREGKKAVKIDLLSKL